MGNCGRRQFSTASKLLYWSLISYLATTLGYVYSEDNPRIKRQLLYPAPSSKVQWVFGLGLPMPVDSKKVNFGLSMKLNYYTLPINVSDLVYPYAEVKERRSSDIKLEEDGTPPTQTGHRWDFYEGLELAIERLLANEDSGKDCILRAICEAASNPFFSDRHGGLAAELLHMIFTPSVTPYDEATGETSIVSTYLRAEDLGKDGEDCRFVFPTCRTSLLELISTISSKIFQA